MAVISGRYGQSYRATDQEKQPNLAQPRTNRSKNFFAMKAEKVLCENALKPIEVFCFTLEQYKAFQPLIGLFVDLALKTHVSLIKVK